MVGWPKRVYSLINMNEEDEDEDYRFHIRRKS